MNGKFTKKPLDENETRLSITCPRCGNGFIRSWDEEVECPECFLKEDDQDPPLRKAKVLEPVGQFIEELPVYRVRTVYVLGERRPPR